MGISAFFRLFQPKDKVFYTLFEQVADNLAAMSKDMVEGMKSQETITEAFYRKMEDYEHANDRITHNIFIELGKNFITPFDREDIHALADQLDDVIDAVNRSAQKVDLYSPKQLPAHTAQLAGIVRQGADQVLHAVNELSSMRKNEQKIRACCKEIKRLEELADEIYENGIIRLFEGESNAVELLKVKEIIQELEKSVNKINSVRKVLKTIIVKYA